MPSEDSLYDRLGGAFAIAAVVNDFSESILDDPMVGVDSPNPQLREWSNDCLGRLPGLKFMRTLWVCDVAGGPQKYAATREGSTKLGLENAHRDLLISPEEFDTVAGILSDTLDAYEIPEREKNEVLNAFAAHKNEITQGYTETNES